MRVAVSAFNLIACTGGGLPGAVVLSLVAAGGWGTSRALLCSRVEAYVFGVPMIMMDLTKEAEPATSTAGETTAPVNQFAAMRGAL